MLDVFFHRHPKIVSVSKSFPFEKVLKGTRKFPALVVLWAPWSPPSREMQNALVEASGAFFGKVSIVSVNVDEFLDIQKQHNYGETPLYILFAGGAVALKADRKPLAYNEGNMKPEKITSLLADGVAILEAFKQEQQKKTQKRQVPKKTAATPATADAPAPVTFVRKPGEPHRPVRG